ncbi:hypothetical protein QCA50_000589 [Cerrena zonata]|uniref:FAD-binding FR-type domain-containing protein n=1 Tax=Cerrena zonata TaxID=2478898 RepID=A0AAW0GZX2_9APHY
MSRVSGITRTLSCNHRISISHAHIRRLSTQKDATTGRTRISSLYTLGVAGGVGIISAYFLWPDASRSAPTYKDATLSPSYFTPAQVLASEPCSHPDYRLITLGIPKQLVPSLEQTALSPIWSIFIKDDDIQVERPYTPLTGIDEEGRMKFWIKKYPKGEVGRWIHSKHVGDSVEIRGPLKTWPWKDGVWDEVVMVSGGTGITPFVQLLHETLLSSERRTKTRYTLLHSSHSPTELPSHDVLQPLLSHAQARPDELKVTLFVNSNDTSDSVGQSDLQMKRIDKPEIIRALSLEDTRPWWKRITSSSTPTVDSKRKVLVLVCGPDSMIAAIAGPFGRNMSQGPIGGILGELGLSSQQVWKL